MKRSDLSTLALLHAIDQIFDSMDREHRFNRSPSSAWADDNRMLLKSVVLENATSAHTDISKNCLISSASLSNSVLRTSTGIIPGWRWSSVLKTGVTRNNLADVRRVIDISIERKFDGAHKTADRSV